MNESEAETKQRLMDAAEILFGREGYENVGIRALTKQAETNLGAVTYHFGSKQHLYVATFLRRFSYINAQRSKMFDEVERRAETEALSVETILECMLRPPLEATREFPEFFRLMGRNLLITPEFMEGIIQKEMKPILNRFVEVMQRVLPDLSIHHIHMRAMFCGGVLLATIGLPKSPLHRSSGMQSLEGVEATLRELVSFCANGFGAPPLPGAPIAEFGEC